MNIDIGGIYLWHACRIIGSRALKGGSALAVFSWIGA